MGGEGICAKGDIKEDWCHRDLSPEPCGLACPHWHFHNALCVHRLSPCPDPEPIPSSGESVIKAVSCQKGGRGLPSCSRDWALRFTLRSLNWSDMLRASRTKLMSWPMWGGSSSWNFKETWTISLGRREGVCSLQRPSPLRGSGVECCESAWWGSSDLPAFSF